MPTYQSCTLQVGSQCPGTSRSFSLIFSTPLGSSMTPCSSEHLTYFTSSKRQARIDRLHLQPGVTDRLVGLGVAHYAGQDEERIFPLALVDTLPVLVEDTAII